MRSKVVSQLDEIKPVVRVEGPDAMRLVDQQLRRFNLLRVSRAGRAGKSRPGHPIHGLFMLAMVRVFISILSIRLLFGKGVAGGAVKPIAFYRFMSDPRFDWRQSMSVLNRKIAAMDDGQAARGVRAFIIDDTISAHYGRHMEGSSKVHDHTTGSFRRGYKLPVLAYHNGNYTRALDFAVVRETRDQVPWQREDDPRCPAAVRKRELDMPKPRLARDMLTRVVTDGFEADYVLVDSWFLDCELVTHARGLGLHVVGMLKMHRSRKCSWRGRETTLDQVLRELKRQGPHRCRRFGAYYMDAVCDIPGMGTVHLFFSRLGRRGQWKVLLSTDLELDYVRVMEIYAVRWTVEVLFKECKSLLGLNGCQCKHFCAQVAHFSTVFMLHALLVSERNARDYRSLGELFRNSREELDTRILAERIVAMIEETVLRIAEQLGGADAVSVRQLLDSPEYAAFKELLSLSSVRAMFLEDAA